MKKIISFCLVLSLCFLITGCHGKIGDYKEVLIPDGKAEILMYDETNKLIETITICYEDDKINKVEYLINEKDNETLELDRKELNNLMPDKLVNSELALYAVYETGDLDTKFVGLRKPYIYEYIDNLRKTYPSYVFNFTINENIY